MKPFIIIILLIIICIPGKTHAQYEFQWDWVTQFYAENTGVFDYTIDSDDNIYVCGKFHEYIAIGDTVIYQPSFFNYIHWGFLMKYNWEGELQWYKIISTDSEISNVATISVDVDKYNNVYLAGRYFDEIIIDSTIMKPPNDSYTSCYLIKFDEYANLIWKTQVYGTPSDDHFSDFIIIDTCIYFCSEHNFGGDTNFLYFENNYTMQIRGDNPFFEISSFNLQGNLNWVQTFFSARLSADIENLVYCDDDTLYLCGGARDTLFVNNDTIYSTFPTINGYNYLFKYTLGGEYIEADIYKEFPISSFYRGPDNDLIIAGVLWTDLIINEDTLIQYNPSLFYNNLIGRFDQNLNPIWINQVDVIPTSGARREFCQTTIDSTIYSMVFYEDSCIVGNNTFTGYPKSYCLIGYENNGDLISAEEVINTSGHSAPRSFLTDNCGNIFHAGYFSHNSFFNNDTLIPVPGEHNIFFGRINLHPEDIELGRDTIACNSFLLEPSNQFSMYSWNDGISNDPFINVTESGNYWLYASNENHCSGRDTIYVSIIHSPDICLGNDTAITLRDTLRLEILDQYDFYTWQDSSNQYYYDITGSEYTPGLHKFWVQVYDSICIGSDTINVNIIDDFSINEDESIEDMVKIYPLPVRNNLYIEYLNPKYTPSSISLYTVSGIKLDSKNLSAINNNITKLDISNLDSGIYFLALIINDRKITYKVIKI